ncbi:dedicator of cytokinesis protein 2-like [Platysternon megacephalum]|uniref:Dedicator of cytokinesis protein 2-like n=1 Tax=Platysternon megacephalum TaxID=55544 RepID=A0A4D9DQ98_9SAUR|nr:dedicator of cytokinesis protein 2-like [Platysternon megacephalum]
MGTPALPGNGKCKAEGRELLAPTSSAGKGLEGAICTICQDYLTDPVTIQCGHNFCWGCITQRCAGAERLSCPRCGETFWKRPFRSNTQLGSIAEFIKQLGLKPGQRGTEGNVCGEHGKELTWFCKEDAKALCEDCRGSPAHHSHAVIPMAKAAHGSKGEESPSSRSENVSVQEQEAISTQLQELREEILAELATVRSEMKQDKEEILAELVTV